MSIVPHDPTAAGGYAVPDDGCASYRALYAGLAELEADTHLHVHKENDVSPLICRVGYVA